MPAPSLSLSPTMPIAQHEKNEEEKQQTCMPAGHDAKEQKKDPVNDAECCKWDAQDYSWFVKNCKKGCKRVSDYSSGMLRKNRMQVNARQTNITFPRPSPLTPTRRACRAAQLPWVRGTDQRPSSCLCERGRPVPSRAFVRRHGQELAASP